jgi:acid phosphatase (class A)
MKTIARLFCLFLLTVTPLTAQAANADPVKGFFISPADLSPQLLPPPPAEGTKPARAQIAAVIAVQRHIPKADLDTMRAEQRLSLDDMTQILGSGFTRERLPKTFLMLDHVFSDTKAIAEADKNFWHTRRPYLVDHRIKLLIDPIDDSPAYPSGHTVSSRVLAEILGLLFPEKLEALRLRADDIARHRIEAGVHYPVDIEGGRMLAMLIVGGLLENDDFHDVSLAAQTEIARSH